MKRIICMVGVLVCLGLVSQAKATIVSFDLDQEFSGATPPSGTGPWFEAKFDDGNTAGSVNLKLEAKITDPEFVAVFMFNFDDTLLSTAGLSIITADSLTNGTVSIRGGDQKDASFKADGDGYYDIRIDFPTAAGDSRFTAGEEYNFTITGIGIVATDFDFLSTPGGGAGIYNAAAHIQGISGGYSSWIGPSEGFTPIPEPATMLLLGTGLGGVAGAARRKIRKNQL